MNQDDIIRMALEAGWDDMGVDPWGAKFDGTMSTQALIRFANLIRADEREACAKVCDSIANELELYHGKNFRLTADECAETIRARGQA